MDNPIGTLGRQIRTADARIIIGSLQQGESVLGALMALSPGARADLKALLRQADMLQDPAGLEQVLNGIVGARSVDRTNELLWTTPGLRSRSGGLTTSLVGLVDDAAESIVCSTYNFQTTSGMWKALRRASRRRLDLRIYIDREATKGGGGPTAIDIAQQLAPATVFRTRYVDGRALRNHAKYFVIDHRVLVVTSANFSWSAENNNVELGLKVPDPQLARRVERELENLEGDIYESVKGQGAPLSLR
ncbi:DISARM system phospholipase D-like protein DrmC [Brachybacterium halotolerans subsp. kimchii]|uniref:DISARM system phospholipase D-like protein DrmC n=1 Tax=Brachybacterium halotolerans TaxID=2795215 RepID=UPI001E39E560|nr:DISARM system phospholipase D-like protein DrmC [Brachybacterium halotolerans]UEJ81850.1 DISARM system phospholipase D-like protein DrmC [Brachybacterium halotolerans subsp. kimchii]